MGTLFFFVLLLLAKTSVLYSTGITPVRFVCVCVCVPTITGHFVMNLHTQHIKMKSTNGQILFFFL